MSSRYHSPHSLDQLSSELYYMGESFQGKTISKSPSQYTATPHSAVHKLDSLEGDSESNRSSTHGPPQANDNMANAEINALTYRLQYQSLPTGRSTGKEHLKATPRCEVQSQSTLGSQSTRFVVSSATDTMNGTCQDVYLPIRIIDDVRSGIKPDGSVGELPGLISLEMEGHLDVGKRWKQLIKAVDGTKYAKHKITQLQLIEQRYQNPTNKILLDFGDWGMTVRELAHFLDQAELYAPLELIRRPEPLVIVCHPEGTKLEEDETLVLSCVGLSFPYPYYTWYFHDGSHGHASINLACPHSTLSIKNVTLAHSGHYVCEVRSSSTPKPLRSNWCQVKVIPSTKPRPLPTRHPSYLKVVKETQCASIVVSPGGTLRLMCEAEGQPVPRYQWYKNCLPVHLDDQYKPTLTISRASEKNSGTYFCVVNNVDQKTNTTLTRRSKYFHVEVEGRYNDIDPVIDYNPAPQVLELHYAQAKVALLIGMRSYQGSHPELPAAENDVKCLEAHLEKMGFMTVSLLNLTKQMMVKHIAWFCELLNEGVYGLFFFIGHGFEYLGQSFLIPVGVPTPYKLDECISLKKDVLAPILMKNPKLCMTIIDMCRVAPTEKSLNHDALPKDIVLPQNGKTLTMFAASAGHQSYEDKKTGKSFFMQYLDKVIDEPIGVCQLNERISKKLEQDEVAGNKQYPQMESNLINHYSLHDPINFRGHTMVMNRRRQLWESATRLPRDVIFNVEQHRFQATISCQKNVSNQMNVTVIVDDVGDVMEYALALRKIPKELYCQTERFDFRQKANVDQTFSLKRLEALKEHLVLELEFELRLRGEKKTLSQTLTYKWPLVSNLHFGIQQMTGEAEPRKQPTQHQEACSSGCRDAHRHGE